MTYTLNPSSFSAAMVGTQYHIGLGDGTVSYGYVFRPDPQRGMQEGSDATTKNTLIQNSSTALIDRDLVFYPRVSQGDYSGGMGQVTLIDQTRFFDSDLEFQKPGYLKLRAAWQREAMATKLANWSTPQVLTYNDKVYFTVGSADHKYVSFPPATVHTMASGRASYLDTDGNSLFIGDKTNGDIWVTTDNTTYTTVVTGTGTDIGGIWVINQGTNGSFVYFTQQSGNAINTMWDLLYKADLDPAGWPITAPFTSVDVGVTPMSIIDIAAYQNGIAILTNDPGYSGFDVWYYDGSDTTRIIRVDEYLAAGITECLGSLYVTAYSPTGYEAPILVKITQGVYEIVERLGLPLVDNSSMIVGDPQTSGQWVYFSCQYPQINGIAPQGYVFVYDTIAQSLGHYGNLDADDKPTVGGGVRQLAMLGRSILVPMLIDGDPYLQYTTNANVYQPYTVNPAFAATGYLVSSNYDFATPGVPKRFRTVEVHHAPLPQHSSITVSAYVDQDPTAWTTATTPVPATATITNAWNAPSAGPTTTRLTMGSNAVGRTLFYVIELEPGYPGVSLIPQATTPIVYYTSVEVGGTWTWEFDLECTDRRLLLTNQEDNQGVNGKDLYFLLRNAYENGTLLTLYLADGLSYQVAVDSLSAQTPAYKKHIDSASNRTLQPDQEWYVHVILREWTSEVG